MASRTTRRETWWWGTLNLAAVLLLYFAVPLDVDRPGRDLLLALGLTLVGLVGVAAVVRREVGRVRGGGEGALSVLRLVRLAEVVLVVFALAYYVLATNVDGQLVGIATRIDALYFSTVTMTTVGYGEIHATGQVARALVTTQLVFDVAVLGEPSPRSSHDDWPGR